MWVPRVRVTDGFLAGCVAAAVGGNRHGLADPGRALRNIANKGTTGDVRRPAEEIVVRIATLERPDRDLPSSSSNADD